MFTLLWKGLPTHIPDLLGRVHTTVEGSAKPYIPDLLGRVYTPVEGSAKPYIPDLPVRVYTTVEGSANPLTPSCSGFIRDLIGQTHVYTLPITYSLFPTVFALPASRHERLFSTTSLFHILLLYFIFCFFISYSTST